MDSCFVAQWGLPTIELRTPMMANALNGQRLAKITQASVPVDLCLSGNHHEQVSFFLLLILRMLPWSLATPGLPNTTHILTG